MITKITFNISEMISAVSIRSPYLHDVGHWPAAHQNSARQHATKISSITKRQCGRIFMCVPP